MIAPDYRKTPHAPPEGEWCDCQTSTDDGVKSCPNLATVELKGGPFSFETWVCQGCAEHLLRGES